QVAEGEERDRDQDGRPGPHTLEVAELHGQDLRSDALGAIQEERDLLGGIERLAQPAAGRARIELVDLQVVGVTEVDEELRRIVGETDDAVATLEVEREKRARPRVVEGERDRVLRTPEQVLDPRRLP